MGPDRSPEGGAGLSPAQGGHVMITLEIDGQFITWPEDFAIAMMTYYLKNGVSFTVHQNCVHTEANTRSTGGLLSGKRIFLEVRGEYKICHR